MNTLAGAEDIEGPCLASQKTTGDLEEPSKRKCKKALKSDIQKILRWSILRGSKKLRWSTKKLVPKLIEISTAEQHTQEIRTKGHVFHLFVCLWTAFRHILNRQSLIDLVISSSAQL